MTKSALQCRAENLAEKFRAAKRPPLVVEFAGVPKAGKTSTLNQVYSFLRRCGFKCEVVVERASVCPIKDKRHFNFNIWTACTSLSQLLEKTQDPPRPDDPDILFLDRGIFDAICWLSLLERLSRITNNDRLKAVDFLLTRDWTSKVSGVIAMSASPQDALQREQGLLPVEGAGGSIMNITVLRQMASVLAETTAELKSRFRIFSFDTSSDEYRGKQQCTCTAITEQILELVEESIEENIFSAPKSAFPALATKCVASAEDARVLVEQFEMEGDFQPRQKIEADISRIQPLPIVVVRNRTGNILQLIRKEREPSSKLHKKITIWAGGHVRREDGPERKGAIVGGAIRELQEELRIYAEPDRLKLIGAVYVPADGSTQKHMAFVYEWRAVSDDVEVALCNSEFMERNGNSLQGAFLPAEKISEEAGDLEDWSLEILNNFLITPTETAQAFSGQAHCS